MANDCHRVDRWKDCRLTVCRSRLYLQSLQPQKDGRIGMRLETLMRNAGFINVESRMLQLPLCGWPDSALPLFFQWRARETDNLLDPREREIGTANRENTFELLSSLVVYPLTERLGISITDVQLLVAQARREAQDPAMKAYFPV